MNKEKIPIIILNWNGLEDTKECMTSVLRMTGQPFEVILVDNGSEPAERREMKRIFGGRDDITLVLNDENKGFTHGNADIVKEILERTEVPPFIALLNNDTVVTTNWITALVSSADNNDADVISSKMINYFDRSKIDNVGHFMLNTGEILPRGHGQKISSFDIPEENIGACGGAVLYRTKMIQEIGFFDPFFDTGYEDAEFGLRAKLVGYKCYFEPEAIIYHKISQSIKKIMDDRYLQRVQINIFYTFFKLMPKSFIVVNLPIIILKYLAWVLIGIFALQFKLIVLHGHTVWRFFKNDLKVVIKERKLFFENNKLIPAYQRTLKSPALFFLGPDIYRVSLRLKKWGI